MAPAAPAPAQRSRPFAGTRRALVAGLLVLLAPGCTYTVRLMSDPDGARVLLPDGSEVTTPAEVTFVSGRKQIVRVEVPGYRPFVFDMRRTEGRPGRQIEGALFQQGGREVTCILIPDHGPVGSSPTP